MASKPNPPKPRPCLRCGQVYQPPKGKSGRPSPYCSDACRLNKITLPSLVEKREKARRRQARYRAAGQTQSRSKKERQDEFLTRYARGGRRGDVLADMGLTDSALDQWCSRDPAFKRKYRRLQMVRAGELVVDSQPFDARWRERYFGAVYKSKPVTPRHLQAGIDLIDSLEGGERGIILMPPNHAKTSLVEDWVCWHIAHNPEIRVVIVSKTEDHAARVVGRIVERLTDAEVYEAFHQDYGPFRAEVRGKRWRDTSFKVVKATGGERDYTCVGMGYKGQVTGRRIDLLVLDDVVDWDNCTPAEVAKQREFIFSVADSRLDDDSKLLVIGTRFSERDLYRTLLDIGFFDRQLILAAEDEAGRYLWPERHSDKWYEKKKLDPRSWALTYQQFDFSSDGITFPLEMIEPCFDPSYRSHEIPDGFTCVLGVDPAMEKHTAGVVLGVNPRTGQRVLLAADNPSGLTAQGGDKMGGVIEFVLKMVKDFHVRLLLLEANSSFGYIPADGRLRAGLNDLRCELSVTEKGKYRHSDEAIATTLTSLFTTQQLRIPDWLSSRARYTELINELVAWHPHNKKLKRDLVQALYYAEVAAKDLIDKRLVNTAKVEDARRPAYMQGRRLQAVS